MEILHDLNNSKEFTKDSTIIIGNFDGVHLGHQEIIRKCSQIASSNRFGILTFNPHPRDYFKKNNSHFKLTPKEQKYKLIERFNVNFIVELKFDKSIEILSPEQFVKSILFEKLGVKKIIVGNDFRFGHKRSGDFDFLQTLGAKYNIKVFSLDLKKFGEDKISSTVIRNALKKGQLEKANKMLGYYHKIYGLVVQGDKRGRELGFPTINLELKNVIVPKFGIYSCMIKVLSSDFQDLYKGVASIGTKPTFGKNEANCEVNIFNFSESIYNKKVIVSLVDFQRAEIKYESINELKLQMKKDCKIAINNLNNNELLKDEKKILEKYTA